MQDATGIALITGASRGLGKSAALHLARNGWDLVITYQTHATGAQETVAAIEALGRKATALQLDTGKANTFKDFAVTLAATLATPSGALPSTRWSTTPATARMSRSWKRRRHSSTT